MSAGDLQRGEWKTQRDAAEMSGMSLPEAGPGWALCFGASSWLATCRRRAAALQSVHAARGSQAGLHPVAVALWCVSPL